MALRRMFANEVVDSDNFISLPASSQNLYFHLGMKADDEGFIANVQIILIVSKTKKSDLNNLIKNGFIIDLGDVFVIRHWYANNRIRSDRKRPTSYKSKKDLVTLNSEGLYELKQTQIDNQLTTNRQPIDNQLTTKNNDVNQMATKCQPTDNQMTTQYSIVKDSIGKDSIVKDSIVENILPGALKKDSEPKIEEETFITLILNDKTEYPIPRKLVEEYKELYPAVDVEQQLNNMKAWLISNPRRRKTKSGILRFVNGWLSREQDRGNGVVVNFQNQKPIEIKETKTEEEELDVEGILEALK